MKDSRKYTNKKTFSRKFDTFKNKLARLDTKFLVG
jgi:hypothetical protein